MPRRTRAQIADLKQALARYLTFTDPTGAALNRRELASLLSVSPSRLDELLKEITKGTS